MSPSASIRRRDVIVGLACVSVVYFLLCFLTKPTAWGDAIDVYGPQIVDYANGALPASQFWEFGHLLWRPLSYLIWHLHLATSATAFDGAQLLQVYAALRVPNVALGYVIMLAGFGISLRVGGSVASAVVVAIAFFGFNPVMSFFQTGDAYIPGLGLQMAGFYFLLGDLHGGRSRRRAWLAGLILALAVCTWFPYLFGMPFIFLLGWMLDRSDLGINSPEGQERLRWISTAFAMFAISGLFIYAIGIVEAHIGSMHEFIAWALASGHGYRQTKTIIRLATNMPRGMLDIGPIGLAFKRFLLHDPYAHVGLLDLFRISLWRLALFYIGMLSLVWTVWRDRAGRPVFFTLLAGALIALFFGIILTYPGQSERWMPFLASVLPATAWVLRSRQAFRVSAIPFVVLLAVTWISDFALNRNPGEPTSNDPPVARMLALRHSLTPQSTLAVLSGADEINSFRGQFPFHELSSFVGRRMYVVTEAAGASSPHWQKNFAQRTLETWNQNGDMWISKRLLAQKPLPEWGWAEGDDVYLHWPDVPKFFRPFVFESETPGADGFVRIARVQANEARIQDTAR
jgi:hypothetical protein